MRTARRTVKPHPLIITTTRRRRRRKCRRRGKRLYGATRFRRYIRRLARRGTRTIRIGDRRRRIRRQTPARGRRNRIRPPIPPEHHQGQHEHQPEHAPQPLSAPQTRLHLHTAPFDVPATVPANLARPAPPSNTAEPAARLSQDAALIQQEQKRPNADAHPRHTSAHRQPFEDSRPAAFRDLPTLPEITAERTERARPAFRRPCSRPS